MNDYFKKKFLMEENSGGNAAGGGAGAPASNPSDAPAPATDDLGYDIVPDPAVSSAIAGDPAKPAASAAPAATDKKPIAGYDPDAPVDPATGKQADPPADPAKPAATPAADDLGFELDEKDARPEDSKFVKEFAKKHKVSKEVAQALLDTKKAEAAEQAKRVQELEVERQKVRKMWHKELKEDKDFGGEHFAHNVKQAEKVIEDFLPNVKKKLTESGSMLPPYIMRDLAAMAKTLYGSKSLVQGEAPAPDENSKDDHLAFYDDE